MRRIWAWLTRRGRGGALEDADAPLVFAPEGVEPTPQPPSAGPEPPPQVEGEVDPRAEALRAKLDEAKAAGSDRDDFESGETPIDAAEPVLDLESRRRSVHDEARSAIEEMRGGPGDSAA
jgi:hypothetical protein